MSEVLDKSLIIYAEDCDPAEFESLHRFSKDDERRLVKLSSHGPVLLRGGRGTGKSALLLEAARRMSLAQGGTGALGVYVNLRHIELLKETGSGYESALCRFILQETAKALEPLGESIDTAPNVTSLRQALSELSSKLGKRIVLLFDDAAHIGREVPLTEFFDIFRTISSSSVSCKAAIYPGVTKFGKRFDVFNDATVLELTRSEELPGFKEFFSEVMDARFKEPLRAEIFLSEVTREDAAYFLGMAVLGNMRAYITACSRLVESNSGQRVGLTELGGTIFDMATNYYWPLLDELKPKLGVYEPMIEPARSIAEHLFTRCGKGNEGRGNRSAIVHRDHTERLAKSFEMLEYSGFISKREASRAMKSGRGPRFALNLCNLFERIPGRRLTQDVYETWRQRTNPQEFGANSPEFAAIRMPETSADEQQLGVFSLSISTLKSGTSFPFGLTDKKIAVLEGAGIKSIGELANASDALLLSLDGIGDQFLRRIRNVVGQAIWM